MTATLYNTELNLDELIKLNKWVFKPCDSIQEVFTYIFQDMEESKIIIKKEENKINVFINAGVKKNEVKIILLPHQASIDHIVAKLCDKVKVIDSLNKIIEDQKITIEKQQKEFNEYKNYNEKKFKELESLIKKESENLKFNIEYYNDVYLNSDEINKIKAEEAKFKESVDTKIMKYNELYLIETGIKNSQNKKIKKFKLLFRASRDGYGAQNFHDKCDGKGNTLTLVKTTTGRRFGGFTDAKWNQNGSYISGSYGFIFSLDNNKEIFYNSNTSYSIRGNSSYGPYFGSDFYISNNCDTNESYESLGNYYNNNGKQYPLTGVSNFLVKDYEVYQLELLELEELE